MSLENNLASIAKSLELIAAALTQKNANPTPVAAPAQPVSVPVAAVPAPVAVVAPVMPALPAFQAPVPVVTPVPAPVVAPVQAPTPPFADKNAMMDWIMTSYRALGAEKGAKIQDVLTAIGYKNINDVPVEKWAELKASVDGLRG